MSTSNDYLVRVVARDANVRGLVCTTARLVNEACQKHQTLPTAAVALGRALSGGVLLGALLKDRQRLAMKFEGNGPLKKILVEADCDGTVRGYCGNPKVNLPLINGNVNVAEAIGKAGFLTVAKDLKMKEPYRGIVQLYSSEIAEDIAYYLTESEQIPSAMGLSVYLEPEGVTSAGGFLIQSLPPSDDALIEQLMAQLQSLPPLTELLRDGETPEALIDLIFKGIPYDILEKRPLSFQCSCSKERMEKALISLGVDELADLASEQEITELTCEYCRTVHSFSRDDLHELIKSL